MIIKSDFILTLILCLNVLHLQSSYAQEITGLWEIKEVKVGDETMTPVAKWTRINNDGSYQSGNGWLQNSEGTWKFDEERKSFLPEETNGIKDEFGAFDVTFSNDNLTWRRQEEGMQVTISLVRITRLPKATADQLVGLWDLIDIRRDGKSELKLFDPDGKQYIFIRWDRIYRERTSKGNSVTGYWHINGHRPEVTLLSHEQDKDAESWRVSVSDQTLKMVGISDTNMSVEYTYQRIHEFPE